MRSSLKKIESEIKNFIINNKFFYFFYKIIKISRKHRKDYYSGEYGEDVLVKNFFRKKNNGFYLDVGCYHPIRGSLTYFSLMISLLFNIKIKKKYHRAIA